MKLERLAYAPGLVVDFYEESLASLGALCERTWHDRLEVVAEGQAAKLWNQEGTLHEVELTFASADATSARDAGREVFPGTPLTFRLADALRPSPLPLEKIALAGESRARVPEAAVMEKLWRAQFADTTRWRLSAALKPAFHFSLVAVVRCEMQAIDQHWSLHRLVVSLPNGEPDDSLAREITFAQADSSMAVDVEWPTVDPTRWPAFLGAALEADLVGEMAAIRARQENFLRRELNRIDEYFENYEQELSVRAARGGSQNAKLKTADRLAAAKAEHTRRRADQVARHEIRVHPHMDALLLVAEPAWACSVSFERAHSPQSAEAHFVPRSRKWVRLSH